MNCAGMNTTSDSIRPCTLPVLCLNQPAPDPEELATLKTALVTKEILRDCYKRVWKWYDKLGATDTVAKGSELNKKLLTQIRRRYR